MVSNGGRTKWNYFSNSRGATVDVRQHPPKIIKSLMHTFVELDSGAFSLVGESFLHGAEHISSTW